jgi:hypothetical protein
VIYQDVGAKTTDSDDLADNPATDIKNYILAIPHLEKLAAPLYRQMHSPSIYGPGG